MFFKYALTFYFRNGKTLEILANQCSTFTDPKGISMILMVDKNVVAELTEGIGNAFEVGEVAFYNSAPRPDLYEYFPDDWDPINGRFNLIDKINIDSRGRSADSNKPKATPNTPNDGC